MVEDISGAEIPGTEDSVNSYPTLFQIRLYKGLENGARRRFTYI